MPTTTRLRIGAPSDYTARGRGAIAAIRTFLAAPERLRLLVIVVVGIGYLVGLAVALRFEWYPQALPGYIYLGIVAVVGAATSRRWPLETLVLVTAFTAYTTLAPLPPELYGLYLGAPQALVPLAIITFILISDNGPVVAPTATFGTLAVLVIVPWRDIVGALDASIPVSDVLLIDSAQDRSMLMAQLVACALVVLFALMLRRQRRATVELALRNQELTQLRAAEVARIAEQERSRIARDMHDEVAHHVAALVIRAQAAVRVADRQPEELARAVSDIAEGGQDVLARIRAVVRVLKSTPVREVAAPVTLAAELEVLFERMRSIGYEVDGAVRVDGDVPSAHRAAIVGVVQESFTNTMLHSAAQELRVVVEEQPLSWTVTVSDPGPARERFPDVPGGGSGLSSLDERLADLGGRLTTGVGADGSGWAVQAELPRLAIASTRRAAA
ncbi:sensor histidine kinase [Herbiconiux sp. P15]|uniref:sensor histidine kinase n=1 Tax=Herbiconiux liukaitaii TaxID=3342799 RepID=UPI0035BB83A9